MKAGLYVAKAESWELATSENGKEYIAISFEIMEGEAIGRRVPWRGFFTEKTQTRTLEALRYCGWDGHDFLKLDGMNKNLVQLDISEEEYKGKMYPKVQWVNRLGGMAVKNAMTDAQRAAFAARMKGPALAVPKDLAVGTPANTTFPSDDQPPPHDDDDMLF
jgi:hypothetical protein